MGIVMNERTRAAAAAAALLLVFATPAAGQHADFLFRRPTVTAVLRGGWAAPRARSEIFDQVVEDLTVERSDFKGGAVELEAGARVNERWDVTLGAGYSRGGVRSEFRDFVEDNDLPIEQTTTLQRGPLELGAKLYLKDRGRSISRYAWVPYPWAPYVGAGFGAMLYRFEQEGDFVDYETNEIFTADFRSTGAAPMGHVAAGAEFTLGPRMLATGEGRYQWARADMGRDFRDFDPIDLSGFQLTVGLGVRF